MLMIKHPVKEEIIAKSVNPISQDMAHEGDDSGSDPKFVGGGDSGDACKFVGLLGCGTRCDAPKFGGIAEDAPNKFVGRASVIRGTVSPQPPPQSGSETAGGTDEQQGRKRKNREIIEADQPAEKEGMNKDKKYRAKKKVAQQEVEKEKNGLKAENEKLERVMMQLKWDKVGLEKQVLELKAEVKEALAEKEKAAAEKEKAEKRHIQRELEITNQKLQTRTEELQKFENMFDFEVDGSLRRGMSGSPPKPGEGWATRIRRLATLLINASTKLPSLQGREEFLKFNTSSTMSIFKYTATKMDANKRLAIIEDIWAKNFHRIKALCILNSHLEPLREMASNWLLKSFIEEEIRRTLCSYYESQEGEYDKSIALYRQIRASTILQSYAGNLDCNLIDLELRRQDVFGWRSFFCKLILPFRPIEILRSIRRYAESVRVEKKHSCIMQFSFSSPTEMWSGILQSFYKPLSKGGVWNLYKLRGFCRLLVVKRRLVLRMKKFRTLRSHFDPLKGRGDLVILVKNSARSVWRFRCATQATRKPVIVGDLVDDHVVFYEGNLPTGAHYRSEIAIVGLGLATWVELESFD